MINTSRGCKISESNVTKCCSNILLFVLNRAHNTLFRNISITLLSMNRTLYPFFIFRNLRASRRISSRILYAGNTHTHTHTDEKGSGCSPFGVYRWKHQSEKRTNAGWRAIGTPNELRNLAYLLYGLCWTGGRSECDQASGGQNAIVHSPIGPTLGQRVASDVKLRSSD